MQPEDVAAPPPDLFVTGHYRERPPYAVYRRHGSGNWLITYTLAGHGLYRQPSVSFKTGAGDLVLLQPDALHDYSTPYGEVWEFLWAHFQPRPGWLAWWKLPRIGDGLFLLHVQDPITRERVEHVFRRLHADVLAVEPHRLGPGAASVTEPWDSAHPLRTDTLQRELALNGLEQVLLLAVGQHDRAVVGIPDHRVQRVLDLMTADLAGEHTLASLAAAVALSPSRLAHLFSSQTGAPIMETLTSIRLRQAARLLEYTPESVSAIAEAVGFSSPFYFSRQFARRYGRSPRAYRATMLMRVREPAP